VDTALESMVNLLAKDPHYNATLMVKAAQLVRAINDYKVDYPARETDLLFHEIINLALKISSRSLRHEDIIEIINRLQLIPEITSFKNYIFKQVKDTAWTIGLDSAYLKRAHQRLANIAKGENVILIVFSGRGVLSGLELFVNHNEGIGSDSIIYPVRFSIGKKGDKNPHITREELTRLKLIAEKNNAKIVIYDDDISSAATITKGGWYFRNMLDKDVHLIAGSVNKVERETYTQARRKGLPDIDINLLPVNIITELNSLTGDTERSAITQAIEKALPYIAEQLITDKQRTDFLYYPTLWITKNSV